MNANMLQELNDKRALDDLVYRQAIAVDRRDWPTYRSCFEEEVHFDFTNHTDRVIGKGFGIVKSGDTWVRQVEQAVGGFDGTSHVIANTIHTVQGDRADTTCMIIADHFFNNDSGDRCISMGGIYTIGSVRKEQQWKIKTWELKVLWYRGNPGLYRLAGEKFADMRQPT